MGVVQPQPPSLKPEHSGNRKTYPLFPLAEFESSLVDWTTVEDGDLSLEMDAERFSLGACSKDKLKPAEEGEPSAWTNERSGVVQLQQEYARAGAPNPVGCGEKLNGPGLKGFGQAQDRSKTSPGPPRWRPLVLADGPGHVQNLRGGNGPYPRILNTYDNVLTGSENKLIYNAAAKSRVRAAMEGYNAVVFGQTASGKTFTLSGSETEPGIIPRAMKDVFTYIRNTPNREFLLRASYLEIYKEQIYDLLSPSSAAGAAGGLPLQDNGVVPGLREEAVMSVKGLKEVLEKRTGEPQVRIGMPGVVAVTASFA